MNDHDLDTLLDLSDADIHCQPLPPGPDGAYRGHDGLAQWIADRIPNAPTLHVRIERVDLLPGGRAAAFGTVQVSGRDISP